MHLLRIFIPFILIWVALLADGQIVANFSADTTSGCTPLTISFENKSSNTAKTYRWSFGNGNLSSLENPQAIFFQPGTYEISLEVSDANGNKDEEKKTAYITVFANPVADFTASLLAGCAPLFSTFNDNSTRGDAPIKDYLWDFGDGNTTTETAPGHTYTTQGKFTVSLLVIDQNKCESQIDKRNYVEIKKILDVDFKADETFDCEIPFTVNFEDKTQRTEPGDTYRWDFGDGSSSTSKNPRHTYTQRGLHTVTLEITSKDGCKSQLVRNEYINAGLLQADFEANKTQVCAPAEVRFKNNTQPNGLTTSWDLGDGTTKNGYNVNHTYAAPGNYTVTMTVEKSPTCKSTITKNAYISVIDKPVADFTVNDTQSCKKPFLFTAINTSSNFINAEWYFQENEDPDSTTSFFKNITEFGNYGLTLTVKNEYNCTDNKTVSIEVVPLEINIAANRKGGCLDLTTTFTDLTEYRWPAVSKSWSFGDGGISATMDDTISHTYRDTGRHKAILVVENTEGCIGRDTTTIFVGMKTDPDFSLNNDTFCNLEELRASVISNLQTPFVDSLWMGTGESVPELDNDFVQSRKVWTLGRKNLVINPEFGRFTTVLKEPEGWKSFYLVTRHNMCNDTIIKDSVFYVDPPIVGLFPDNSDPCRNQSARFLSNQTGADSVWYFVQSLDFDTSYFIDRLQPVITIDRATQGNTVVRMIAYNDSSKCYDSMSATVNFYTVYPPKFTVRGELCAPANLTLTRNLDLNNRYDQDLDNDVKQRNTLWYNWTVDDSTQHFDQDYIFHSFSDPGTKKAKLVVIDQNTGCRDSLEKEIVVTGPTVSGSVTSSTTCLPIALNLTCDVSPLDFDSLYWLIEGRRIPVSAAGTLSDTLYSAVGADSNDLSTIRLVAVDSNGCIGTQRFPVEVDGPKDARIKISRFGECNGQRFIFTAERPQNPPTSFTYFWEFGNGDTSSARVKQIFYSSSGVYDVNLYLTDATTGCVSKITEVIDIEKERLNADFDADSLASDCPPLFVQFKNTSTSIGRQISKFYWEFGDGSTSVEENPSKLYLSAGKFTVKLFVTDEWGCSDSIIYPDFVIVNGPEGSYTFDEKLGCVPLTVNFTSTTERTNFYEWDMGDGTVIENTPTVTHVYNQPGRFIPLLILKDTFGCNYTLPPIDTIYVDPFPEPQFEDNATCVNVPITMKARNQNNLRVEEYIWELNTPAGMDTLYGEQITYTFIDEKYPIVKLTIVSKNGCSNSITKNLRLISLDGRVSTENEATCVGTWIQLQNTSISDTTITSIKWIIDGVEYTDENPRYFASEIGPIDIQLIQENILGCTDTLTTREIVIGDSIKPKDIDILRVSVVDDLSILLDHKRADMLDFKEYRFYKEENNLHTLVGVQGSQDVTRFILAGVNTLVKSHCLKIEVSNTCGLVSDTLTHRSHCTIETQARGDTNANKITWSKYIGWDSVSQYHIYRNEVDQTGVLQRIATIPSDSLTYTDSLLYCNTKYTYRINGEEYLGNRQLSSSDTAQAMPIWDYTPPPNELVRATVDDDIEITIEWDSTRGSVIPIARYVLEKSKDGVKYTFMTKQDSTPYSYIDKEVKVDLRSYFYRTYAIDECEDTSSFLNFGKTILLKADTSADQRPLLNWSHYEGWLEDTDYYAVEIKNPDGTFNELDQFPFKDTTYVDLLTDLNQRPNYCYRIVAYRSGSTGEQQVISISNEDCSPVRSKIYYPNAFTPNRDNLNDHYRTPSEYIKDYHIQIFNRWGEMIFESFDLTQNWDGTYKGKDAQMDAYAVIVITTGVDNVRRVHHGTITLVR